MTRKHQRPVPHEAQEVDQYQDPKPEEDLEDDGFLNVDAPRRSGQNINVTDMVYLTEPVTNTKSIGKKKYKIGKKSSLMAN